MLCSEFTTSVTIGFDAIAGLMVPTAEKVADKWLSMTFVLNRIIQNWEKSGQGDIILRIFSWPTMGMI